MSRERFRHSGLICSLALALLATGVFSSSLAAQDEENPLAIREFTGAANLQNGRRYASALTHWQKYTEQHKNSQRLDEARYNIGICQLHLKKYEEAAKAFSEVLAKHPQFEATDALRYNLGMAHYLKAATSQQAADYTKAAKAFGEAATKHADSKFADRALYFQGEALFSAGQAERSRQAFTTLVNKYPQSALLADAYYALGTAQQEAGLNEEAAKTYSAYLANDKFKDHEYTAEIRLRLAMTQFAQENYQQAEKQFEQLAGLADFPNADFALLRQAQCRYEQDDIAKAAELNQSLVKKFPESPYIPTARLAAGKCFYQLKKWNDARSALEDLAKSDGPAQQEAAYWLARTLLRQEKPADALNLLDDVAGKIPADHEFAPHVKLARLDALYAIADRRAEAATGYAEFAKQYAQHELAAQAQYMAALAALEQEDLATARQHAEAFLANPDWQQTSYVPSVLFVAAEAHLLGAEDDLEGAQLAKAEGYYRKLVSEHADDMRVPRSHLRIGWLLYRGEQHAEAAQYLSGIVGKLSQPEHKAEAHLLIGRSQLDSDKAGEAIGQLQQALGVKNDWTRLDEGLILLAQAYRQESQPAEAAQQLSRLESQFKQSPYRGQALYLLGETSQQQSNYDEAAARYQAVLSEYADDPYAPLAAYGLGAVRIAQGNFAEAEAAFSNLMEKYDTAETRTLAKYWRGVARHRQRKFGPATADLQQFVAEAQQTDDEPTQAKLPDALYTVALCQIGENQLAAAGTTLATLLKNHPDYQQRDKAYYELGHSLLGEKKQTEAVAAFESLTESSPESPLAAEAYFHIGSASEEQAIEESDDEAKQKQFAAAATAYTNGLKTATEAALKEKLQYKLGDMQFRQEDFTAAAETLQALLKEFPQGELTGPARYLAGESLFKLKQFEEALPLFEQVAAEKVEPYTAQAYYRAGAAAAALKNWAASEKAYESLLQQYEEFPQAAEARYGQALALHKQNQLEEANKLYEQIASNSTSETAAKARYMVGEIAFGKKQYEQAIDHYLVTASYPYPEWQGLAHLEAGRCFKQLNKPAEAKQQFQIIVQKYANHDKAADAARLLAELNK